MAPLQINRRDYLGHNKFTSSFDRLDKYEIKKKYQLTKYKFFLIFKYMISEQALHIRYTIDNRT